MSQAVFNKVCDDLLEVLNGAPCSERDQFAAIVSVVMYLAVDRADGDVDQGLDLVIGAARHVGEQMREWEPEDRLLLREAVN